MKQIFDWLREQMRERIKAYRTLDTTETAVDVAIKETERFVEYINEAEAKWEAEVCEWKECEWDEKQIKSIKHPQAMTLYKPVFRHCPYCGKRIKILEVE